VYSREKVKPVYRNHVKIILLLAVRFGLSGKPSSDCVIIYMYIYNIYVHIYYIHMYIHILEWTVGKNNSKT